jgi:hypothetical protein
MGVEIKRLSPGDGKVSYKPIPALETRSSPISAILDVPEERRSIDVNTHSPFPDVEADRIDIAVDKVQIHYVGTLANGNKVCLLGVSSDLVV